MDIFISIISAIAQFLGEHFTSMSKRTYWVFLLSALLLAFVSYLRDTGKDWSLIGFARFVFPKKVWLSRSSWVDYSYFVINAFVMLLLFAPMIAIVYPKFLALSLSALTWLSLPAMTFAPKGIGLAYFVSMILIVDFMIFFGHYLSHKVPFLWQFHKVHHAAEVLNPMTLYRQHPVDLILNGMLVGVGTAFVHAIFSYFFSSPFSIWTLGSLNLVLLVFYLAGYNLRHSHIRLSYGRVLDRWLISPVQHQLHHSSIEKHFDKNMGLVFAFWDKMFKTHYIPAKDEHIELGLPDGEAKDFASAYDCYIAPFKKAFPRYKFMTVACAAGLLGLGGASLAEESFAPPSLHLEELTWDEVGSSLEAGYRSVIIPTGGVEQNGLHVVLGKHKGVIKHTSTEIASRLGQTLIAPVIDYVPEGRISPPEGHMNYAGTISVREEVFEMVLEDTAKSLYQHGFTHVYIMGDSGSSVDAQQLAVDKLAAQIAPHQHILHVTDYYSSNGQTAWLKEQGYSQEGIGYHAGMRDTSELMAAMPEGVRADKLLQTKQSSGATGSYWKANPELGRKMLDLKIGAATAQIERARAVDVAAIR